MSDTLSEQTPNEIVEKLAKTAQESTAFLRKCSTESINSVLQDLAQNLRDSAAAILSANNKDISKARERGLTDALIDRLALDADRINAIAHGVETVRDLEDPVGRILWSQDRPNGLRINRISCPIGVLGMIYESRPNVTVDAAILSLKSHNAVILRGGSESLFSSLALHKIIQSTLQAHDFPQACVSMIPISDRDAVSAMLRASQYIDVMIPRGGKGLIERVMNEATMPVFSHLDGICHIYVDQTADAQKAIDITLNAKMRRTGVCGAMETLLLDSSLDKDVAKTVLKNLLDNKCTLVGDESTQQLDERIEQANEADWSTEYLDSKLSVRFIDNVEKAVEHINHYGSHHTDSIICEDEDRANYFLNNVDSGIVMHNASTQFADGGEFGMGAEIGIATGKMHARGPVGLEQLCTYKYQVHGQGQTRP